MTNMLAYTMLTFDCKSSYVHLGMLKHAELHCSVNVFKLRIDGISVHSKHNNMNTYMKTVCVVFLQQTLTSKYTPLDAHLQLGLIIIIQKLKNVMKCQTTVSLCKFSIRTCLPTSPYNSHKHFHICT